MYLTGLRRVDIHQHPPLPLPLPPPPHLSLYTENRMPSCTKLKKYDQKSLFGNAPIPFFSLHLHCTNEPIKM